MSSELVKNIVIYSAIPLMLILIIWLSKTQKKTIELLKIHNLDREKMKVQSSNIPEIVSVQMTKLKMAFAAFVGFFLIWSGLLYLVLK